MTRAPIAAVVLLLAGCPLPQPLPDYPPGAVTPPRILMDHLERREAVIRVPAGCSPAPSYVLAATLVDPNTSEAVIARWFVDYDPRNSARCDPAQPQTVIQGPGDDAPDPTLRQVPAYPFRPYDHPAVVGGGTYPAGAGVVHVVELVVSNRFDAAADRTDLCVEGSPTPFPFRTAVADGNVQFETQTYRWVFVSEPPSSSLPCPEAP
ncbi:MAG TPA: hypothetical protein VEB43_00075 [Anaeromyxobacter sp.]|nr:hypothetical protein [Anaeromyxobacter sp.]